MSYDKALEAADYIKSKCPSEIRTAIVLGSGLATFAERLSNAVSIPFEAIPNFARSTVEGHPGRLVLGELDGVAVVVQQGRFHYYEGYEMEQILLPVRAFGLMGDANVILTNAAGSLNDDMKPGSLMMITDHLNLIGVNPLRGPNDAGLCPRFPAMTEAYDEEFQQIAHEEAELIA